MCIIDIEEAWLNTIEQAKLLANEYVKNVLMGTRLRFRFDRPDNDYTKLISIQKGADAQLRNPCGLQPPCSIFQTFHTSNFAEGTPSRCWSENHIPQVKV